jgi:hypothetical protein
MERGKSGAGSLYVDVEEFAMQRSPQRLPRAVRLIFMSWAMGAGIGALVAAAALGMEGSMLGQLVAKSDEPWIPTLLLFGGMMTTFAGLSAGTAIMLTR